MKKPYATDWIQVNKDTQYSESIQLYWHNNGVYDRLSAMHNGIIGAGAEFKELLKGRDK